MHQRSLWRSRRGNFAITSALILPMLVVAGGLAVDASNVFAAKSALQAAVDAATLAASNASESDAERQQQFDTVLKANAGNGPSLYNVSGSITFDRHVNSLAAQATASANVRLDMMQLFHHADPRIEVSAATYQSTKSLEVAMVLDNTGSLGASGIESVRQAASGLVDILQDESVKDGRDVKVALVPFVTAVNVKGSDYSDSWIDTKGVAKYNGANFDNHRDHLSLFNDLGVAWKGCVEARPTPYNFTDAAPSKNDPDTLFVPYFAPDEPGAPTAPGNDGGRFNNSYLDDQIEGGKAPGDANDQLKRQRSTAKYTSKKDKNKLANIDEIPPLTNGPNRACPTPIVPLTADFTKIKAGVNGMNYWNGSGTNVSEGMAWGWRVLSPGEPYTEGAPFNSEGTTKVVILFTDGENVVFGASTELINRSDYGAYGFLDAGRFNSTNQTTAARQVDTWTNNVCTSLKSLGVDIYAVLLNADSASNRKLYPACVSAPENYYAVSNSAELKNAFAKIGAQVTKLYLSQ
ncbi:MAG: pilus assembly protein TadG-related protein [Pararhizobium sp.]